MFREKLSSNRVAHVLTSSLELSSRLMNTHDENASVCVSSLVSFAKRETVSINLTKRVDH